MPLARRHQVRLDPRPVHVAEPFAEPPEACDHLVVDPEEAVLVAERAQPRHVVHVREGAAGTEHRLADDRCDILGPDRADDVLRRLERRQQAVALPVLMLGRRYGDVSVRRPARYIGDIPEACIGRDVVAVAPHHRRAHGHAVEGMRLGQDDAAPGVEPRHGDAALRRLGAGGQDAKPAGPALLPENVRDHQLRGAGRDTRSRACR